LLALSFAAAGAAAPAYNVLFLMTDEHNPRVLGCYGDQLVATPTLDALAARGVRFTAAYCQNPICVPSRVSLVSGRMASTLGVRGNSANPQYENISTLADVFTQAGYQTAWLGKPHWGNPRFPADVRRGGVRGKAGDAADEPADEERGQRLPQQSKISSWPVEENPEHLTTNRALEFMRDNRARPFFLGVSFVKPHFPFTIQAKYYEMYRGKVALPRAPQRLIDELPAVSRQERAKYKHAEATTEDILRTKAIYYGMVTYVDEEFGRIVRQLDELGLREKTIIVYTVDHGEMLGDRGIWYKNSFYDQSARVPFIWSFPKELPTNRVVAAPAMNLDIFPTLCDLCGLAKPAGLEGRSLVPLLRGTETGADRFALSENYRGGFTGRMIRTAQWKYFFYTNGEEYLYDLSTDPDEETNLVKNSDFRRIADELKQKAVVGWPDAAGAPNAAAAERPAKAGKRNRNK
jgi:choline-sulfatase